MNKESVIGTIEYRKEITEQSLLFLIDPVNMDSSKGGNDMWLGRSTIFMNGLLNNSCIPRSLQLSDLIHFLFYYENDNLKEYVINLPGMTYAIMSLQEEPDDSTICQHGFVTMPFNQYKKEGLVPNTKISQLDNFTFLINKNNLNIKVEFDNMSVFSQYKILEVTSTDFIDSHVVKHCKKSLYEYLKMYESIHDLHRENTNQMIEMLTI